VPQTEIEPNVFVRATDNWWEISGRFVVPIRTVRTTKSELTKRVRERFDEAGIEFASSTNEQYLRFPEGLPQPKP
jgi:small-conductance mechanosensitive channel